MSENTEIKKDLTPLQRALIAVKEMRAKVEAMERAQNEPIAIVGMACRFPGSALDLEGFWRLLDEGGAAVDEIPPDRWDVDRYYDPDPEAPGKMYVREGSFLKSLDTFDAGFFGITPREAVSMDPQQRLLLEVAWETLENAGMAPTHLDKSSTGVFVGIGPSEYFQLQPVISDPDRIDAYVGTGCAASVASGRVSYFLGLRGPTIAVDTACSSSLVAIDIALQYLRAGKCRVALAGGVNAMVSPGSAIYLSKIKALSPDGRCKTFDEAADGYGRGEGCGMIALKRLSDAQTDGDRILAIVLGSAVNHDGHSSGLTVPNGAAQQEVIREALANAGIQPSDVDYIEAHGTGTSLGDPIEIRALDAVFGPTRGQDHRLIVGTVKTNIGHLEAAAGIAGVIKVVLAMQHGRIPRHLNLTRRNPHVPWDKLAMMIPIEPMSWPDFGERPIAGVSAFGFSGTNAHVVLQAGPKDEPRGSTVDRPVYLLPVSAKEEGALKELAAGYGRHLDLAASETIGDICYTAGAGRSHFGHRLAVIAEDKAQLTQRLSAFVSGDTGAGVMHGVVSDVGKRPKIAFLFTGQGSQYVGMGRELYETQPSFRATMDACDEMLRPYLDTSLIGILYPEPGAGAHQEQLLNQTYVTQPALFALEYALAELWRAWGIEPSAVMGHSVGEYVAACVAGLYSLEGGIKLIAERGRLMQALPAGGRMAAVIADAGRVAPLLDPFKNTVSLAAFNGPENTVISGVGTDVQAIMERLSADGIESRPLTVSHAFHSPLMEPMLDEFEQIAAQVAYKSLRMRLISNLTGKAGETALMSQASWWRRHVREPVQFVESIKTLHEQGCRLFLEIGSHPTLLGMAARCLPEGAGEFLPSLRRGRGDWQQMLESMSALYVKGAHIDWQGFDRDYARQRVVLPTYAFQRKRYWIAEKVDVCKARSSSSCEGLVERHPLLGRRLESPLIDHDVFEFVVSADSWPLIKDHVIYGLVVFPAAGYLEMALSAGRAVMGTADLAVEDIAIELPMTFDGDEARRIQVALSPVDGQNRRKLQIYSAGCEQANQTTAWVRHVAGQIRSLLPSTQPSVPADAVSLDEIRRRLVDSWEGCAYYDKLRELGIDYGIAFRTIERVWFGTGEALGRIVIPQELSMQLNAYQVHPVLLDGALQVVGAGLAKSSGAKNIGDVYLPISIGRFRVQGSITKSCWVHIKLRDRTESQDQTMSADIRMLDDNGNVLAELEKFVAKRADSQALRGGRQKLLQEWLYEIRWQQKDRVSSDTVPTSEPEGQWLVFADPKGAADELIRQLEECGNRCIVVYPGAVSAVDGRRGNSLDPAHKEEFQRLLADLGSSGDTTLCGVIHLWSLGIEPCDHTSEALETAQELSCGSILHLIQAMDRLKTGPSFRLWLITAGAHALNNVPTAVYPGQTAVWGLGRVVASEHPELHCTCVDLDPADTVGSMCKLTEELHGGDREDQIIFRAGARYVARIDRLSRRLAGDRHLAVPRSESYCLRIAQRGLIENLELAATHRTPPGLGQVEIEVHATGLNFRDVLNVLGMYPGDPGSLGSECAGRITAVGEGVDGLTPGDNVIALASESFSNYVLAPASWVVLKPEGMSDAQAATIPITFLTAYHGLFHLAGIRAGDQVLIHAAAGGVGMAAVQLAKRVGAEVFGTAGSPEKRAFLKSMGVDHVMNSRTLDFADQILQITQGRGVDIVLNALAGDFIPKSLSVMARGGRFIEIGKADILNKDDVARIRADVSYTAFDLAEVIAGDPKSVGHMFARLFQGFREGSLRPLPVSVFPVEASVSAFRFMAQARHIGKVVVSHKNGIKNTQGVRHDASYLITGGTGGLGLIMAQWLVARGARHLVLMGRSTPHAEAREIIQGLEAAGATVHFCQGDISRQEDIGRISEYIGAPLRGIIHAAGTLDDSILRNQDWQRFSRVLAPKIMGSWLLHRMCRDMPLDFFIMFSSTSSILGAPGQGSYAAANAFMDGLAHMRRASGLPALSINWGPWSNAGMAAGLKDKDRQRIDRWGFEPIAPEQGMAVMDFLIDGGATQVAVMPVNWTKFLGVYRNGMPPVFSEIEPTVSLVEKNKSRGGGNELKQRFAKAPEFERQDILASFIGAEVAKFMGLDSPQLLDLNVPLVTMGFDSLMAVELRHQIERDLGIDMSMVRFLEGPSISQLVGMLLNELTEATASQARSPLRVGEKTLPELEGDSIGDDWEEGVL